jgi:hypothetical protein
MKQSLDGLNGQNSRRTRSKDGTVNIVSCPLCDQAALFFRLPQTSTKIPDRSSNAPHRESVCPDRSPRMTHWYLPKTTLS